MPGLRELGLIMVVWAASTLIFQDLVVRFDIELVHRLSGITVPDHEVDKYRRRLGILCWGLLAVGMIVFLGGVALQFTRH